MLKDYKNLPMTAFYRSQGASDPPQFASPRTAQEQYNQLQGLSTFGDPLINPQTGQVTKFWYPGDPVTGTGWIHEQHRGKRFLMGSGPFYFADGDTQEVALAIIMAQGNSGLNSVTWLKRYAQVAQYAYDTGFAVPPPPPSPAVVAYPDSEAIVLNWDQSAEDYVATDSVNIDSSGQPTAYTFQGYNVYQLDAAHASDISAANKIASFDIIDGVVKIRDDVYDPRTGDISNVLVQDARDTGLQRFYRIPSDALNGYVPFIKNQPYYFAVTAYAYNFYGSPKTLESPLQPLTVRPQSPPLGSVLTSAYGDTLQVVHRGRSNGRVEAIVVAPGELTGQSYAVSFRLLEDNQFVWDVTSGEEKRASGWKNQGELGDMDYPIVDGVLVQVFGPPVAIDTVDRSVQPENGGPGGVRWISGASWGGSHLFGGLDLGVNFFGSTVRPQDYVTVDWRFTSNPTMSEATGWMRCYVYRRDQGYAAVAERGWAPFQAFDMSDSTHPRQLNVCFVEDANEGKADLLWNPIEAENTGGSVGGREYTFIMLSSYDPDGNIYDDENYGPKADVLYALWPRSRGSHPYQESDFWMRIIPNFVNAEGDTFVFKSTAPIKNDLALARQQAAELINVFPNPVDRGLVNLQQPYAEFVTFTHLPEHGTVLRIYTLAGDLVRRIEHDNGTQFESWDLRNADGRRVASGIYIVHIDMGAIGVKVLKLGVL